MHTFPISKAPLGLGRVPLQVLCKLESRRPSSFFAHKLQSLVTSVLLFAFFLSDFGSKPLNLGQIDWDHVTSALMFSPGSPEREPDLAPEGHPTARALNYLVKAELGELDPWRIDDLRVSRLAIANAYHGIVDPWGFAFWTYYGKTLPKALKIWAEQDAENQRVLARVEARILAESLPPKKSSQSIQIVRSVEEA